MAAAAVAFHTLIVEDDFSSADVLAAALDRRGFEHETAYSVGAALLRLEEDWPQAVILDLRLPDADGTVLLRRIRRENRPTRVAVVTGVSDLSHHVGLMQFPPDLLLRKPVDLTKLVRWLERTREEYERGGPPPF